MSISDDVIAPPPRILSNSPIPVPALLPALVPTPLRRTGPPEEKPVMPARRAGPSVTFCSVKEFHWPHDGHLPNHFGESAPQLRQTNKVF
jgi:hypothetical protein